MQLNASRTPLEQIIKRLRGLPVDEKNSIADRVEAARLGKQIRPYFSVLPLDSIKAQVAANEALAMAIDPPGFRAVFQAAITDQHQASALFNIRRRRENVFTRPRRASYLAGDSGADANRVGVQDYFYFPQPLVVEPSEDVEVVVTGRSDTLNTTLTNTYFTMRGLRVYGDMYEEAQFTADERRQIVEQITVHSEQDWAAAFALIDYTIANEGGSKNIKVDALDSWALLMGVATTLRHSLVDIKDPRGHVWSNDLIPSSALGAYPFYGGGAAPGTVAALAANIPGSAYVNYLWFSHPYLMPPRQSPTLTCTKRPAAGGYTNNIVEVDTGEFAFIYKLI